MTDTVKKVAEAIHGVFDAEDRPPNGWKGLMLAAARAAISAMQGWRPIEEAPKDGTIVDLWIEGHDDMVDFYAIGAKKMKGKPLRHGRAPGFQWGQRGPNPPNWYAAGDLPGMPPLSPEVRATHFMPVPLPPEAA